MASKHSNGSCNINEARAKARARVEAQGAFSAALAAEEAAQRAVLAAWGRADAQAAEEEEGARAEARAEAALAAEEAAEEALERARARLLEVNDHLLRAQEEGTHLALFVGAGMTADVFVVTVEGSGGRFLILPLRLGRDGEIRLSSSPSMPSMGAEEERELLEEGHCALPEGRVWLFHGGLRPEKVGEAFSAYTAELREKEVRETQGEARRVRARTSFLRVLVEALEGAGPESRVREIQVLARGLDRAAEAWVLTLDWGRAHEALRGRVEDLLSGVSLLLRAALPRSKWARGEAWGEKLARACRAGLEAWPGPFQGPLQGLEGLLQALLSGWACRPAEEREEALEAVREDGFQGLEEVERRVRLLLSDL